MNDRSLMPMLAVLPFDETDDDLMESVCEGPTLARPVQALLITLSQIHLYENSFGLDKAKAYDAILPDLVKLLEACKKIWRDE